jgi:hypothetical protein
MRATQHGRSESRRIHVQRTARLASSAMILLVMLVLARRMDALSMVASSSFARSSQLRIPTAAQPSVTSSLVSRLAVMALKLRLQDQSGVNCDVTATSSDLLLKGKVGPVTVKGRAWQSRLGLTCRAIEATVDSCDLDMGRVFASQKLVLNTPGTVIFLLDCVFCCCHNDNEQISKRNTHTHVFLHDAPSCTCFSSWKRNGGTQ